MVWEKRFLGSSFVHIHRRESAILLTFHIEGIEYVGLLAFHTQGRERDYPLFHSENKFFGLLDINTQGRISL